MNIAIASDHAGFDLKNYIKKKYKLKQQSLIFEDFGTNSNESCDYPEYVHPLAQKINAGNFDFGILICGSANGVAITANKYEKIRAAICWNIEITKLARLHNNANVICLPARFIEAKFALQLLDVFLTTKFEAGRHQRRVEKISKTIYNVS